MEARYWLTAAAVLSACTSMGASHRTQNFTCNAATRDIAVQVCESAERYRRDLAIEWLGRELPNWGQPCPITVQVGERLGAGGATSFVFDRGEVFGWQMTIQGSLERVLDSVLPHEVTHTIFASHFRQPLPRWADEGACTTVEHPAERTKQQRMLIEFLQTGRGIAFSQMFAMKEYPPDVLPLYAQGHSLASYLIAQGGKHKYLQFVADGMDSENWSAELQKHYGIRNLGVLQTTWLDWVAQGSPPLAQPTATLASAAVLQNGSSPNVASLNGVSPASGIVPQRNALPGPASTASFNTTSQAAAPLAVAAASPYPAEFAGKRPRPQPNLLHYDAERSILPPTPTVPQTTAPQPGSPMPAALNFGDGAMSPPPIGPGELVPIQFPTDATSGVVSTPIVGNANQPLSPAAPRQVILEWSKEMETAGVGAPGGPSAAPLYDASAAGGTLRR